VYIEGVCNRKLRRIFETNIKELISKWRFGGIPSAVLAM
jgi:hypothetical protein